MAEGAKYADGVGYDIFAVQKHHNQSLLAKAYASAWAVRENKHKWARPNFDKHFYGVGAGVMGLLGILYALYPIVACVSVVVDAGWSTVCVLPSTADSKGASASEVTLTPAA